MASLILLALLGLSSMVEGLNVSNFNRKNVQIEKAFSRRDVLEKLSTISLATTIAAPETCFAAPPMTVKEADSASNQFERKRRKAPPKLLRAPLNLDFAVLLMRSSYNAMDEIDCVAMDQFQKDFFFIRQAEYLPYTNSLGPGLVKQGDLSDAYYFDFISFAQYSTIFRDITIDPPMVFEEQQPIIVGEDEKQQFISKVIKRDPSLDNSKLAQRHDELVGEKILDKLNETFAQTASAIPSIQAGSSSINQIQASIQQLVNLFLINGYAFNGSVNIKKEGKNGGLSGAQIDIILTAPANLWSGQALQLKKAFPTNDFIAKTTKVMLRRAGFQVSSSVKYTSSDEITTITFNK